MQNRLFYIDNRPEIGDTLSLIPLINALHEEHPDSKVFVSCDDNQLLPSDLVSITSSPPKDVTNIWHQTPCTHEYGDYYRRTDDFYYYPIRMAKLLGWLQKDYDELPVLPKCTVGLPLSLKAKLAHLQEFIVVAPQASNSAKSWSEDSWNRLLQWLISHEHNVVVIGRGPSNSSIASNRCVDLRGKTTIKEASTIIAQAKLLIGLDSAPVHLAMGHGVRSIILQGPTAGATTLRYDLVRAIQRQDGGCVNCYQRVKDKKPYHEGEQLPLYTCGEVVSTPCMRNISVTQVTDAVEQELCNAIQEASLSICIMAKNEAKTIKPCLESAYSAADEIILVDTGSTDGTVEIAKLYSAKVRIYENTDVGFKDGVISNFAAARNFVFSKANCKYVMWMDAGDRIADPKKLREEVLAEHADVIFMNTVIGQSSFKRERVVRREFAKFEHRVHEVMDISGLSTYRSKTHIDHVCSEKVGREQSMERNIRLLKRMLKEKPNDSSQWRWYYYLGRDLKFSGQLNEALQYLHKARDGEGFYEERAHAAVELARVHMDLQEYNKALEAAYEALKICDGWRDPYYLAGEVYFELGDYKKAIPWYTHCLGIPKPETDLWLWDDLYTYLPQCQLSYCYALLNDIDEALFWVQEEQKHAPEYEQKRIANRIEELKELNSCKP